MFPKDAASFLSYLPFIVIFTLASYLVYWFGFGRFKILKQLGIPGPEPQPFIAHMRDFMDAKFNILTFMDRYVKKYGDVVGIYLQGAPTVMVSDPELLKQILVKDFSKFHDRKAFIEMPEPLNSSLTNLEGEKWTFVRNTLSPSFTSGKLRPMTGMINNITDTFIGKCRAAAEKSEPVDISEMLQGLTMEAILSTAFGVKANSQSDPDDELTAKAKLTMSQPAWLNLVSLIPGSHKFIKYLPWGFKASSQPLSKVSQEIIRQRKSMKNADKTYKDLLQLMLNAQKEPDKHGRRLSDLDVIAQALIFLVAGYETTSTTLGFVCYYLAKHKDVQEKLYQEIKSALREDDEVPGYDEVHSMEYLDMVISETLRLYPPGYLLIRDCTQDCVVNGIPFKKGFKVIVPVYSLHRDERYFKNPDVFDPNRFSPEEKKNIIPYTYLPFGSGPHNCIGMRFALMEIKLVIARLIKEFELDMCSSTKSPPAIAAFATITIKGPLMLTVSHRTDLKQHQA